MHFNLFHGCRKFNVVNSIPIRINATTVTARKKMSKAGRLYTPELMQGTVQSPFGYFQISYGTQIELLAYSLPYNETSFSIKVKLDCRQAVPNLGCFYLYTDLQSLEKLDVEPIQ